MILPAYPLSVCFQVTTKCPFTCPHCCSSSTPDRNDAVGVADAQVVLQSIRAVGVPRINFSGGEPFRHPDIEAILTHARNELGFGVSVTTSGTVTDTQARLLRELGVTVAVSLDSSLQMVNDALRFPGCYELVQKCTARLKQHQIPFAINCTVQRANFAHFEEFLQFCVDHGYPKVRVIPVRPEGRGLALIDHIGLNQDEVQRLHVQAQQYAPLIAVSITDRTRFPKSFVLIEPNGNVWSESVLVGNVLESKDFGAIWHAPGKFDHVAHHARYAVRRRV